MNLLITNISNYALHLLNHHSSGIVHSVYQKTINLAIGHTLLTLQTKDTPLSPLSLITNLSVKNFNSLKISTGQTFKVNSKTCSIDILLSSGEKYSFCFLNVECTNLYLNVSLLSTQTEHLLEQIKTVLIDSDTNGFSLIFINEKQIDLSPDSFILSYAKEKIRKSYLYYMEESFYKSARELSDLIGVGIGLTPSGDDFLCGVLAGLILINTEQDPFATYLKKLIGENLNRTNDISAAFLSCALKGQFSQAVCSLPLLSSSSEIYKSFGKIGHSSGMDTLCGILYVLLLYKNIK